MASSFTNIRDRRIKMPRVLGHYNGSSTARCGPTTSVAVHALLDIPCAKLRLIASLLELGTKLQSQHTYFTVFHINWIIYWTVETVANEARNYVEYYTPLKIRLYFAAWSWKIRRRAQRGEINIFSYRILRHNMATTLQICFLHLCLAQICAEDANNLLSFSYIFGLL